MLKRVSIDRDWIMRATDDVTCREAAFARADPPLPPGISTPALGAAHDGAGHAILMRDISDVLLPQGLIDDDTVRVILRRVAELHRATPASSVPWCDLRLRLTLLTHERAQIAAAYGAPVARDLDRGWRLFERHATPQARTIIGALTADAGPLLRALARTPAAFLHGDLKFDNLGVDAGGSLHLIDWAMPLIAPPAAEMGWFLAINARRTALSLDELLSVYAESAGMQNDERAKFASLAALSGLLLRGWRKAIDAEDGAPEELQWWCEHVEAAEALLT